MKKHDRQNSNGYKLQQYIDNDLINKKHENLLKTYRKKYQFLDPNTFQSIEMTNSNLNKLKQTQFHRKVLSKSKFRKSQQKKVTNRISTQHHQKNDHFDHARFQNIDISTRNKLLRITRIMQVGSQGQIKSVYKKIIQNNEEYMRLIRQWKTLNNFDQNDLLVQKIIENYNNIVLEMAKKYSIQIIEKLHKYQQIIQNLVKENQKLQKEYERLKLQFYGQNAELQYRILGQYQKNQWATLIFNQLETNNFNLEYFVQNSTFFKRWILSLYQKDPLKKQQTEGKQYGYVQKEIKREIRNKFKDKSTIQSLYSIKIKRKDSDNGDMSHSCL